MSKITYLSIYDDPDRFLMSTGYIHDVGGIMLTHITWIEDDTSRSIMMGLVGSNGLHVSV